MSTELFQIAAIISITATFLAIVGGAIVAVKFLIDIKKEMTDFKDEIRKDIADFKETNQREHAENQREHAEMRAENQREHAEMIAENQREHEEMRVENQREHAEMIAANRREHAEMMAINQREHAEIMAANRHEHEVLKDAILQVHHKNEILDIKQTQLKEQVTDMKNQATASEVRVNTKLQQVDSDNRQILKNQAATATATPQAAAAATT